MKQLTYAERQYKLAYSAIRQADSWADVEREFANQLWNDMQVHIESSYIDAAVRSSTLATKKQKVGVLFWKDLYGKIIWGQGRIPVAMKIKAHVHNWFIPF